jgi:hypothetical protein
MGVRRERKGVMFFTVDALIAGVIFVLTVSFLLSFLLNKPQTTDIQFYLNGYSDYIINTKMEQFTGNYDFVYYDPDEPNPSLAVYQKVLLMTESGRYPFSTVQSFVQNFSGVLIPEHVGVEYKIDSRVIYSRHADRVGDAKVLLTTSMLTFAVDENNAVYGPNVTTITVWV